MLGYSLEPPPSTFQSVVLKGGHALLLGWTSVLSLVAPLHTPLINHTPTQLAPSSPPEIPLISRTPHSSHPVHLLFRHTAAFHVRVRGSVPGLGGLKETKNVSSLSTCENQYCGEPPWPRGNVLDLRPPGLEFRILCLEDSVISIISPSSGGSPGRV